MGLSLILLLSVLLLLLLLLFVLEARQPKRSCKGGHLRVGFSRPMPFVWLGFTLTHRSTEFLAAYMLVTGNSWPPLSLSNEPGLQAIGM